MQMKTFRQLRSELNEARGVSSKEYVPEKDSEEEISDYKPRSKGEEKFKKDSNTDKVADHPAATDDNFKSKGPKGKEHKGGKKHAGGEDVVMQGTSKIKEALDLSNVNLKGAEMEKFKKHLSSLKDVKVTGNKVTGDEMTILKAMDKYGVS